MPRQVNELQGTAAPSRLRMQGYIIGRAIEKIWLVVESACQ